MALPVGLLRVAKLAALAVWALLCAIRAVGSSEYLIYIGTRGETIELWTVLSLLDVLLTIAGVAGGLWFLRHRKPGMAALFFLLPIPTPFVIEANRCDVFPSCYATQWAILPREAFDWDIRIRDVTEQSAEGYANEALRKAGLRYTAWYPKLANRQWRLETRNDDFERGPDDVVIDARTGGARIIPRQ